MKFIRLFTLLLILLIVGGAILAPIITQQSWMLWFAIVSPILALILFSVWWAFFGAGTTRKRLLVAGVLFLTGSLVGGELVGALAGKGLVTRYEGSVSGASLPKLVPKWTKQKDIREGIETRINGAAVSHSIAVEAASARTNFLGDDGGGTWQKVAFSFDWSAERPKELWRRPIGDGWSSFAIASNCAVTLEQTEAGEQTTCIDLLTGSNLWTHLDPGVDVTLAKEGADMGGQGPRATPTIHDGKVYVAGSTGIAKCLTLDRGELVWTRNILSDFGGIIPRWGKSSAPLVLPEYSVVVFTGPEEAGATLVACDLLNGTDKWQYQGQGASYSTPRLLIVLGIPQIVSVNQFDMVGIDPKSGEEWWRYEWPGNFPKVGQPMLLGSDRILATASYGVGSPLIKLAKEGDLWSATQLWKSKWMKTKFSSASIVGDYAYGIHEGRLLCIDLTTGDLVWKRKSRDNVGYGQQFLVEDHLLIQGEAGDIWLGQPTPEQFTEKFRLDALSAKTWNAPSLAGRFLLLRNDREAVCFLLPRKR